MVKMGDLVEAKSKNIDLIHNLQPYADGSEKFKQSKESQDTLEKTTMQGSETVVGVVSQSSATNDTRTKKLKGGIV